MRVCVFEDEQVAFLEPLTLTRPAFDLRCGARTLWQRQQIYWGAGEWGASVRPHLADLCRLDHSTAVVNDPDWQRAGPVVWVNARWLPGGTPPAEPSRPRVAIVGDEVAYAIGSPDQPAGWQPGSPDDQLLRWRQTLPVAEAGGWMIRYSWDLVERNGDVLRVDFPAAGPRPDWSGESRNVHVVGPPEELHVHPSATVECPVVADTTRGPVAIDRDAVVQAFSRLEGPCYVGPGSWVIGARVRGSTLGPGCRVGGEVEATVVHGHSNKYHDGFLGHSYVGEWVNLAAGTQVSDLRNDYGPVSVTVNGRKVDTGLSKVGSFIGDHTKTGLGALFNTGSVVGVFCNLLPSGALMPRVVPSFCRYARGRIEPRSDWGALLETAARVMQRRGREFTDVHANLVNSVHELTAGQRARLAAADAVR
jgi:UDP-N-acetylglucosamine diphosphorylase/glucosamine-1-phosphate N-acetyltransferase